MSLSIRSRVLVVYTEIMQVFLIVTGLLALAEAQYFPRDVPDFRIINGEDAKLGEIPFQVSLQTPSGAHFCGGSVLNTRFIITAAHCVKGQTPDQVKVIAGTVDLREPKLTKVVEKIVVHEKYNAANSWINDIALIKIRDEFVVTSTLGYVKLPKPKELVPAESVAVVSGWGRIKYGGALPKILQKAKIQIADQEFCKKVYSDSQTVHDTQICAYDPNEERGACNGDSGGPLIVDNKLVGIVSWSRMCALTTHPTVYTRVSEYLQWIDSNVY